MESKFSDRLKEAMAIRGLKAVDLCEKTNIHKSALSQYLSGKFVPKQGRLWELAKALNVSEVWLMGYDVPMETEIDHIDLLSDKITITGRTGLGKSSWIEKSSSKLEELENVVSWHRDGKTTVKQLTKEEMKLFEKMMEAMGDDTPDYL